MLRLHHVNTIHRLGDLQIVASSVGIRVCVHGKQFGTDGNLHRSYAEVMLTMSEARALHDALGAAIDEVAVPTVVERAA